MDRESQGNSKVDADYHSIPKADSRATDFPVKIEQEYRVHIEPDAYSRMKAHAKTSDEVELCGVLLGEVCRDAQGTYLRIEAIIEGEAANNYGAQVTFTHDTWTHIHTTRDRDYPQMKIVGWYHTHPGFGVFLSGMDMFIQENFFNQSYQVAIVLETKQHVEGCFAWERGASVPLRRYWVGDQVVELAGGEVEAFHGEPQSLTPVAASTARPTQPTPVESLLGGNSVLIIALVFICGLLLGKVMTQGTMDLRTRELIETELYSTLEFAALNASASEDFIALEKRVGTLRTTLPKNSPATEREIKALQEQLTTLVKAYGKRRGQFRKEMEKTILTKRSLSQRVSESTRIQHQLSRLISQIYILRVSDLWDDIPAGKIADLSPTKQRRLQMSIETVIGIDPRNKIMLQKQYPGLLEFFYPEKPPEKKEP